MNRLLFAVMGAATWCILTTGATPKAQSASAVSAPSEADLNLVRGAGPLHELVKKSYAHLLRGPVGFGSDWDNPNEPGDGRGRWMMALCHYGAYLGETPPKMLAEMARMRTMRNQHGFFGLNQPPEVIQAQASFDNSWPIQWGVSYSQYFGDAFGLSFARSIADAFYVPRIRYFTPYKGTPDGHWSGEYGHSGVGLGGMVGLAKLALATGDKRYAEAAQGLAELFLSTKYEGWHGHCTSTAVLGLTLVYELTGDKRYLDAAIWAVDTVFLGYELPYMGHTGGLYQGCDHSEGCGVADYFYLHLRLGRLTAQTRYFDRAEQILWGPFFHHIRPSGGMGVDGVDPSRSQLKLASMDWAYDADMCCSMWAANGLVRAFAYAVLAEPDRLTIPLYFPYTATTRLSAGKPVKFALETSYPDEGRVIFRLRENAVSAPWTLRLRVPDWGRLSALRINEERCAAEAKHGWLEVRRAWQKGDVVSFNLALPVWLSYPNSTARLTTADLKPGTTLQKVRLSRGPVLLGLDKERNADLDWKRGTRFLLMAPSQGANLALPQTAVGCQGFDPAFLYPNAHLQVATATGSGSDPQVTKSAILTPIAEAPGRLGASPDELKKRVLDNREAVVFDVFLPPAARVDQP